MTITNRKIPVSLQKEKFSQIPMAKAVIDHICLDIEVIPPLTKKYLGRPWLTLLIDVYSRRVLSYSLSLDSPSYVSIMMTIRECVKKNSMVPETIVNRDGKEFENGHLNTLLSALAIQRITYPIEHFSIYERLLFKNLRKLIGNVLATGNFLGGGHSAPALDLVSINSILSVLLYQVYDQQKIPALGSSPRGIFDSISTFRRLPREIMFDDTFSMLTLPQIEKKVFSGKGIRVRDIFYWDNDFLKPSLNGEEIKVKYDPLNTDSIFAYLDGKWKKVFKAFSL
jgi:putative transposase